MIKLFKLQQKVVLLFILAVVASFIFCLGFMTDFHSLYGLEYGFNEHITEFHESLQVFNKIILAVGIFTLLGLIAVFVLQVNKKVCDKLALIIMSIFCVTLLGISIYGIINLATLFPVYQELDMSRFYDEKSFEYVKSNTAFFVGYAVYAFTIVASITTTVVLSLNHFKFLKLNPKDSNKVEEGVNNG